MLLQQKKLMRWLNSSTFVFSLFLILAWQPECAASDCSKALELLQRHEYAQAAPLFEKARKSSPGNPDVCYYQALNYHYLREWNQAREAYWQITQKFPNTNAAKLAKEALLNLNGNIEKPVTAKSTANKEKQSKVKSTSTGHNESGTSELASLPDLCSVSYLAAGEELLVDAEINSHPIRMVFDTGAGGVALGQEQLPDLGLPYPHGQPSGFTLGSSNKSQVPYWTMRADVRLGNITRHNFPIYVLESNQAESLIGQEFFSCYQYSIDPSSSTIRFVKNGTGNKFSDALALPFKWDSDKILVDVEVNGHKYPMWFDTGNTACAIHFRKSDLSKLGLSLPDDAVPIKTVGVTGSGLSYRFYIAQAKLGPVVAENVEVLVTDEDVEGKPLVGRPLYSGWECTVDNTKQEIRFLRR